MTVPLKYAHVERERRWLLATLPDLSGVPMTITDQYLVGTRLRLREVVEGEAVVRKLGHKVRLDADAGEVACTNFYLDDAEWAVLSGLPAQARCGTGRRGPPVRGGPRRRPDASVRQ